MNISVPVVTRTQLPIRDPYEAITKDQMFLTGSQFVHLLDRCDTRLSAALDRIRATLRNIATTDDEMALRMLIKQLGENSGNMARELFAEFEFVLEVCRNKIPYGIKGQPT